MMRQLTPHEREEIARIVEIVAKDGLPGPRDLDVALDAIEAALAENNAGALARMQRIAGDRFWMIVKGRLSPVEVMFGTAILDNNGDPITIAQGDSVDEAVEALAASQEDGHALPEA